MINETQRAKIEGMIKRCEDAISVIISVKASLEAMLYASLNAQPSNIQRSVGLAAGPTAHSDERVGEGNQRSPAPPLPPAIVEEFPMPNPDALNKGPLHWLLRKLEEEQAKGHMEVWHAIDGDKVRFEVRLKPEATPEDRKKLNRWIDWVKKTLKEVA